MIITPAAHRECKNFVKPVDRSAEAERYMFYATAKARHAVETNSGIFDLGKARFEVSRETDRDYSVRHDGICIFVLHRANDGQLKVVK